MRKLLFFSLIGLFLFSCNDENVDMDPVSDGGSLKAFDDYLGFIDAETDRKIIVQSFSSINDDHVAYSFAVSSKGSKPIEFTMNGGELFKGDNIYVGESRVNWNLDVDDLSMHYGKDVVFDIREGELNKSDSSDPNSIEIYIPEEVSATIHNLEDGKLKAGSSYVTWNADDRNENGVILAVEYKPHSQFSEAIATEYNEYITKGVTLEDNGSYTITEADLAEFPNNATLSFYIVRAGYKISSGDGGTNDISVGAYTALRTDLNIIK